MASLRAPTPTLLRSWQDMLQEVFVRPGNRYRQLAHPLGLWTSPLDNDWIWWLDPTRAAILQRLPDSNWQQWFAIPTKYQQQRFRRSDVSQIGPSPASQRASVRVTGRFLRLLDKGSVLVTSISPPASFYEALQQLPPPAIGPFNMPWLTMTVSLLHKPS